MMDSTTKKTVKFIRFADNSIESFPLFKYRGRKPIIVPSNITKIVTSDKIQMIDADGEIVNEKDNNRGSIYYGLTNTFRKLKRLVKYNIAVPHKVCLITLTYRPEYINHADIKQTLKNIYRNFAYFDFQIQNKYSEELGGLEYIYMIEPYKNNFHIHSLYYAPNIKGRLFLPIEEVSNMWKYGYIDIKGCYNINGILNYLMPHNTNDSENKTAMKMQNKYFEICNLPSNTKLIRHSRGFKQPEYHTATDEEMSEVLIDYELVWKVGPYQLNIGKYECPKWWYYYTYKPKKDKTRTKPLHN